MTDSPEFGAVFFMSRLSTPVSGLCVIAITLRYVVMGISAGVVYLLLW